MHRFLRVLAYIALFVLVGSGHLCMNVAEANSNAGKVSFKIYDAVTEQTVPCRIHLIDSEGKPQLLDNLPSF